MIQKTGIRERHTNTKDKFYTTKETVKLCCDNIINHIKICKNNDLCIEPSAGHGSFIKPIKKMCNNFLFYDIDPENSLIQKKDFLLTKIKPWDKGKIHIIGNPPFGRQSSTAIKFIKKCCKFAHSISFILPKSFNKESMKKYFDLKFHLIFSQDIPKYSFTVNGNLHDVPCVFNIWVKKKVNREIPIKLKPLGFKFVKKTDSPDISFRRVGVYAGKVSKVISDKSEQSHYFLSIDNFSPDKMKIIEKEKFNHCKNNTVGPNSISKQELIKIYNNILQIGS